MPTPNATALNAASAATASGPALALAAEGGAPDWVQLLPAGPFIRGRDGRSFGLADPVAVANRFRPPFAIDWEHAQDLRAPSGEAAPAAAWVEEVQVRNGQIWGRVDWTERGRAAVAAREYRFLSPAFTFEPATNAVVELVGAGLVNRPNFDMAALNREEHRMTPTLLTALGLPATAGEPEALTAIAALRTATNAQQTPSLEKFVPRADYDAALNRAVAAEARLSERDKADHQAKVEAAIGGAVKAGKITPASRDFYLATCRTAEGLAEFEKFVAAAPSVFGETDIGRKEPGPKTALNAEQKAAAVALGIPEAEFAKFVAVQAAA